ncbi:hypothetical protein [Rhodococcoides corynebacterioides]|nr:hypothetical protein [Rhodococcus corynebacterioides]
MEHRGGSAQVDVVDVRDAGSPAEYDAVVVGSAVYLGRWLLVRVHG